MQNSKGKGDDFGWNSWSVKDVLIPPHVGRGHIKTYYQRRTLSQYFILSAGGLWIFYNMDSNAYRAAALGFLFPGAGYVAVATIPALVAAALTTILLGLALVAYFTMGAISMPLTVWLGSSITAGYLARKPLYEPSGWFCATFAYGGIAFLVIKTHLSHAAKSRKATERNKWLVEAVEENIAIATSAPVSGSREVSLETLHHIQFAVERGLSASDDFSYHDVIEQFQGSALRYQLYSLVDALSLYQRHYAPNFHGYVSQASRNAIEKSLRKEVVSFWKWEAMFGLLKFDDWNPFKNDNIMVTGYLAAAMGLYGQATGDKRYQMKDCMEFVVTESKRYKTDYQGLIDALNENMTKNPFTLYPCEPSWTFPVCNLIGYSGLTMSDNLLGGNNASKLRSRFERSLEEEFTDRDGVILALRSELTGFPMRSVDCTLFDCMATMLVPAFWPHIGHRSWAIMKKEVITHDERGQLQVRAIGGPDKADPGNYQKGPGRALRAFVAVTAGEYGDEKIRQEALDQLDGYFPVEATNSGSLRNKGLSALSQSIALMARLVRKDDLANAAHGGPSKITMEGPLLAQAPFPKVLVAKAFSEDGQKLELVLYNGREAGMFRLDFERLVPNQKYALSSGGVVTADSAGRAFAEVSVSGRTQIIIVPVV